MNKGAPSYHYETLIPLHNIRPIVRLWMKERNITWSELGYLLGWTRGDRGDTSRVKRRFGLKPEKNNGKTYYNRNMRRRTAERVAIVINHDIREFE